MAESVLVQGERKRYFWHQYKKYFKNGTRQFIHSYELRQFAFIHFTPLHIQPILEMKLKNKKRKTTQDVGGLVLVHSYIKEKGHTTVLKHILGMQKTLKCDLFI